MEEIITLDYGSGGKKTSSLIEEMILPLMDSDTLNELGDGAVLEGNDKLVYSTDSFVVSPIFFKGGDIGKLSVCGTVNDVSMAGGEIKYLSLSFIIEEGFKVSDLKKVIESIAKTCKENGVKVVTGDTKVVEKGKGDGLYINTSGIGFLKTPNLSPKNIREGDVVIVSGSVGDHGTAIMLERNKDLIEGELASDCASLKDMALALGELKGDLKVMRDPTRGGVATTLNEFIENSEYSIELNEDTIPIKKEVQGACDILGLDPMYCANEGKLLAVVSKEKANEALEIIKKFEIGKEASIIGMVSKNRPGKLVLHTSFGGSRILSKLSGAQLPRIC